MQVARRGARPNGSGSQGWRHGNVQHDRSSRVGWGWFRSPSHARGALLSAARTPLKCDPAERLSADGRTPPGRVSAAARERRRPPRTSVSPGARYPAARRSSTLASNTCGPGSTASRGGRCVGRVGGGTSAGEEPPCLRDGTVNQRRGKLSAGREPHRRQDALQRGTPAASCERGSSPLRRSREAALQLLRDSLTKRREPPFARPWAPATEFRLERHSTPRSRVPTGELIAHAIDGRLPRSNERHVVQVQRPVEVHLDSCVGRMDTSVTAKANECHMRGVRRVHAESLVLLSSIASQVPSR